MTDLAQLPAAELSRLYRKGRLSPVETMKAVLARVDKVNPTVNALCLVDGNAALKAARAAWTRLKSEGSAVTYWQQDDSGRWVKKA